MWHFSVLISYHGRLRHKRAYFGTRKGERRRCTCVLFSLCKTCSLDYVRSSAKIPKIPRLAGPFIGTTSYSQHGASVQRCSNRREIAPSPKDESIVRKQVLRPFFSPRGRQRAARNHKIVNRTSVSALTGEVLSLGFRLVTCLFKL